MYSNYGSWIKIQHLLTASTFVLQHFVRASDCCLTPSEHFQLYQSWWELYLMRWWWCLLFTYLDFYSAISLKQYSMSRHVSPLRHIILIASQPVFALTP